MSARAAVEEQKNIIPSVSEEQKKVGPNIVVEEKKNAIPSVGADIKPIAKFDPATIENPPEA